MTTRAAWWRGTLATAMVAMAGWVGRAHRLSRAQHARAPPAGSRQGARPRRQCRRGLRSSSTPSSAACTQRGAGVGCGDGDTDGSGPARTVAAAALQLSRHAAAKASNTRGSPWVPRAAARAAARHGASITRVGKSTTGVAPYHRHGSGESRSSPPRDRCERGLAWLVNSAKTVTIHPLRGLAPPLQPGNLTRRDHPPPGHATGHLTVGDETRNRIWRLQSGFVFRVLDGTRF